MKKLGIVLMVIWALCSCSNDDNQKSPGRTIDRNYTFSGGKITQNVLESYLSRAITQSEFLSSDGFYNDGIYSNPEDDERMLLNIGAKFIGRAIYSWGFENHFNQPQWLANAKAKVERMHAEDPDIIFQAGIFEIVTDKVNQVEIPDWVFTAFGKTPETRNFDYNAMKNPEGNGVNQWGNGSVPDITREETRMFFYYMAVRYMEIGIEAIHFGQVELIAMGDKDNQYAGWNDLLTRVREAAKTKARRGTILCDGHMPGYGILVDGKLLFDFVSFPMRIKEISGDPEKAELKKFYLDAIYGRTQGGITPSGWSCTRCPYLVEFDNFGISSHPGTANMADHFTWGYDEISWFYRQPESYRNEFLVYADSYLEKVDPVGFVQMPGSRVVTLPEGNTRYRVNTAGDACPEGQSQEETIKKLWTE